MADSTGADDTLRTVGSDALEDKGLEHDTPVLVVED
jgi:hypothetical protein